MREVLHMKKFLAVLGLTSILALSLGAFASAAEPTVACWSQGGNIRCSEAY